MSLKCNFCFQKFKRFQGLLRHFKSNPTHDVEEKPKDISPAKTSFEELNQKLLKMKENSLVKKTKKRKTNKGKIIARTTLDQRIRCVSMAEKDYDSFLKTGQSRQNLSNWKKQKDEILKLPAEKQRSKNYLLTCETSTRKTGLFPKQQLKLKSQILERRRNGEAVSGTWTKARMKFICEQDKPAGYNSEKHKFTDHWFTNFLNRHGLSIRKKTNKKKTSVFQRLHKINNYKFYCIYKLADDPISSESESESESSESESESSESSSESNSDDYVVTSASESESEDS